MRYIPTKGRVIVFQERARKSAGGILLAEAAQEKNKFATVKAVAEDSEFKVDEKVFFDYSAGSIIADNDDGVWVVLDESDILAKVEDE